VGGLAEGSAARTQRETIETIAFAPREEARDVVTGLPGSDLVVVYATALAVRARGWGGPGTGSSDSGSSDSGSSHWEILRPALPPGARIARVAAALGRFWLATDRGLLEAESLAGPWRRASAPAGKADVRALVGDADSLYVASATRLLRAEVIHTANTSAPSPLAGSSPDRAARAEPRIQDLHRAAIAHLSLTRSRMDGMHSRVGRRGWLPVVSVRAAHDRDRDWDTDRDQTFTYGALHDLVDRGNGHNIGTGVSATFSWDFGDVVFHPEEIDVSREVRSLLALRDDVLDELTQLYFDRQRALVQRAALLPTSFEAQQLQLRADELAAGMDAWTGGWFTRALRSPVSTHLNSP